MTTTSSRMKENELNNFSENAWMCNFWARIVKAVKALIKKKTVI